MNNLAQPKRDAKQAYLDQQISTVADQYTASGANERAAVIRNIDGFLPTLNEESKKFWLKVRRQLERINEAEMSVNPCASHAKIQSIGGIA